MPHAAFYGDFRILLCLSYLFFTSFSFSSGGSDWEMGIIGCGILYFFARFILTFFPRLNQIFYLLLLFWGISEVIYGQLQLLGITPSNNGLYYLTGSFSNPGPFSGFLATLFPLTLCAIRNKSTNLKIEKLHQWIGWIGLFCFLSLLPVGMSRAAWLATIIGGSIVLIQWFPWKFSLRKQIERNQKRFWWSMIGLWVMIFAIGIGIYLLKKDSADGRLLIWKVSTHLIAEQPWVGIGGGQFAGAYGKAQATYFANGTATPQEERVAGSPEYSFNEFLQITVEHGLLGLGLFLFVLINAFQQAWRNKQIGLVGSLSALLTFSCFSYPFHVPQLLALLALFLALAHGPTSIPFYHKANSLVLIGTTWILLLIAFIGQYNQWQVRQEALQKWQEERIYYNIQIYEGTVDCYRKIYPALQTNPHFLFEFGQCLSKTEAYQESNQILQEGLQYSSDPMFWNILGKNYQALGQYSEAENCFLQAHHLIPHRLYPLYLLAKLYFSTNQITKGIDMAQKVVTHSPKIASSTIEDMKIEMKKKLKEYKKNEL